MAFPTVATTNTSVVSSAGTSHTVNLPTGISSGDLLIVGFTESIGTGGTVSFPTGWTALGSETDNGGIVGQKLAYRIADGTEGSTITVTTSTSTKSAHVSYRITGWHGSAAPEITSGLTGSGDTSAEVNSLTPSWGSDDTLWLEWYGGGNVNNVFVTPSTNFTNGLATNSTGQGADSNATIGSARRSNATATESPDAITCGTPGQWVTFLTAVRPAASGPPPPPGPTVCLDAPHRSHSW